ncbi:MAG: hypothetical protein DRI57_27105 [Deltaproteobacteria bacterium]|nr:MAG: hypothetical protein DRI57_27105 [Deltaproteobacteria bacterium]
MGEVTMKNLLIALVALGLIAYGLSSGGYIDTSKLFSQNPAQTPQQTIETPNGKVTQIIAISSVTLRATFVDALNESTEFLNPTFYVWRKGATQPTSIAVSNGQASVTLSPYEKITYAAGSDGSIYWVKDEYQVGATDDSIEVKLYQAPSASGVSVKVFDDSYHDLTNGNYNISVGSGQDFYLQVVVDVLDEYKALRAPALCVDYDTSVINKVDIAGLRELDAPTRLVSGLDQCFDLGIDYYLYNNPKITYDVNVDVLAGVDPSNSPITFYIIDRDIWYKDGNLYFVNPITNANMGSTDDVTNWKATIYVQ